MMYRVDFNDIDEHGRVIVLRGDGPLPIVGSRAYMGDHEGNRCWGTINTVADGVMYVDPDWTTWTTVRDRHLVPLGWWVEAGVYPGASQGSVGVREAQPANTGDAPVRTVLPRVRQPA
jgi:hypothetical protein